MAGAMRKIAVYLGLVEDRDRYDEDYDPEYDGVDVDGGDYGAHYPDRGDTRSVHHGDEERSGTVAPFPGRRHVSVAREAEPPRITTLHPRTYNDARKVGEYFRDGTPVIMNLTEMDDADAKRLVDFAAGLIFGLRGDIERVTAKVFLLSPPNVTVRAEDKELIAEAGFYNQS